MTRERVWFVEYAERHARSLDRILYAIIAVSSSGVAYLLFSYQVYRWNLLSAGLFLVIPLLFVSLTVRCLRLRAEAKVRYLLACASVVFALYICELSIALLVPLREVVQGVDRRSKLEVINQLRGHGIRAYPSIAANHLMAMPLALPDGTVVTPLTGIANTPTVLCNELGSYYTYHSDELGFNNPRGIWSEPEIQLALLGDSFTQGSCVPDGKSYAEVIRGHYSLTINLGNEANGPLTELAILREFLGDKKPRRVIWFFFEGNDIEDLSRELSHTELRRYLDDRNYSQRLVDRTTAIDSALREMIDRKTETALSPTLWMRVAEEIVLISQLFGEWVRLENLRRALGLSNLGREWTWDNFDPRVSEDAVDRAFRTILIEADDRVKSWNGTLSFVYLPTRSDRRQVTHPWRRRIFRLLRDRAIPLIDLQTVFLSHPHRSSLFPARPDGHYSEEGNRLVAEAVLSHLEETSAR